MRRTILEIFGLIALGALSRLISHLPNMTAIGAIALKSRARFGARGILVPLAAMALTDAIIGFYNWKLLLSVYASFALIFFLGTFLYRTSISRIIAVSSLGAFLFFFITNTLVWATSAWYPHTASGLLACLAAGLPFLYPMLAGDIIFSLVLFRFRVPAVNLTCNGHAYFSAEKLRDPASFACAQSGLAPLPTSRLTISFIEVFR